MSTSTIEAVTQGRPLVRRGRKQVGITLRPDLLSQAQVLAKGENRTVSNMLEVLIERGLRAYGLEVAAA